MRVIHRYWHGPDQPNIDGVLTDADLPAELAEWVDSQAHKVDPDDIGRHRANCVRWWLLREHGGVWLDCDATFLSDPPEGCWVLERTGRHVAAGAVGLTQGHGLAQAMIDAINGYDGPPLRAPVVSGQRHLARLIDGYPDVARLSAGVMWLSIP